MANVTGSTSNQPFYHRVLDRHPYLKSLIPAKQREAEIIDGALVTDTPHGPITFRLFGMRDAEWRSKVQPDDWLGLTTLGRVLLDTALLPEFQPIDIYEPVPAELADQAPRFDRWTVEGVISGVSPNMQKYFWAAVPPYYKIGFHIETPKSLVTKPTAFQDGLTTGIRRQFPALTASFGGRPFLMEKQPMKPGDTFQEFSEVLMALDNSIDLLPKGFEFTEGPNHNFFVSSARTVHPKEKGSTSQKTDVASLIFVPPTKQEVKDGTIPDNSDQTVDLAVVDCGSRSNVRNVLEFNQLSKLIKQGGGFSNYGGLDTSRDSLTMGGGGGLRSFNLPPLPINGGALEGRVETGSVTQSETNLTSVSIETLLAFARIALVTGTGSIGLKLKQVAP